MNGTVETRNATIWLGDDGIVRSRQKSDVSSSIEDAMEFIDKFNILTDGKPRPLLADISGVQSITKEARKYLTGDEPVKMITASAILVSSPVSRLIGNFFIGLSRPKIPVRLFDTEEKAVEWLQGYIK